MQGFTMTNARGAVRWHSSDYPIGRAVDIQVNIKVRAKMLRKLHAPVDCVRAGAVINGQKGLGANTERQMSANITRVNRNRRTRNMDFAANSNCPIEHVYLGRADKFCDAAIEGVVVDLSGGGDLQNFAVKHYGNAVCHGHSFRLIVRHIDKRRSKSAMHVLYFRPHLHT